VYEVSSSNFKPSPLHPWCERRDNMNKLNLERFGNLMPFLMRAKHVLFSEVATVHLFSFRKYPKKVHRHRSRSVLHFVIGCMEQFTSRKKNSSARRSLPAALLERWSQVCRHRTTLTLLHDELFRFYKMNSMKCLVHWIPLRIRVRSRNTPPT